MVFFFRAHVCPFTVLLIACAVYSYPFCHICCSGPIQRFASWSSGPFMAFTARSSYCPLCCVPILSIPMVIYI